MSRKGFTLLELIIVIIIVGVLASIALPRFFKMIERTRATEALVSFGAIRQAMERCYLMTEDFRECLWGSIGLSVSDFNNAPNAHFEYGIGVDAVRNDQYTINAWRNTRGGGELPAVNRLYLRFDGKDIIIRGLGAYAGIK